MPPTLLSPTQLNLRELFSVKSILLSRGFEVTHTDGVEKLLLAEENQYDEIWIELYNIYNDSKFRTELKKYLYDKITPKSNQVIRLVNHPKFINEYQRFDNTFEWFAGELMIKKFAAFSASFGVTVRDIIRNTTGNASGDYDSLVVLRDTNLAYFECKAGGFDNDSILKCYERMLSLNCQYSILFCVTNIDEDKLVWDTQKVKIPIVNLHSLNKIHIKGKNKDIIYELNNCYILDMADNIENKLRTILRINTAKINSMHYTMAPGNDFFEMLGYVISTIDTTSYNK